MSYTLTKEQLYTTHCCLLLGGGELNIPTTSYRHYQCVAALRKQRVMVTASTRIPTVGQLCNVSADCNIKCTMQAISMQRCEAKVVPLQTATHPRPCQPLPMRLCRLSTLRALEKPRPAISCPGWCGVQFPRHHDIRFLTLKHASAERQIKEL